MRRGSLRTVDCAPSTRSTGGSRSRRWDRAPTGPYSSAHRVRRWSSESASRSESTEAAAARLVRESRIGPWSVGVVCLEGLGRYERGLVGDLGLVKLLARLRGRRVEGWETAELLEPYGEWAGLASVYMLAGLKQGTLGVPERLAA